VFAATPIADIFRKVRLVCSLDTQCSWQEFNLVSIVRMIVKDTGASMRARWSGPKWNAIIFLLCASAAAQTGSLDSHPGWRLVWSDEFNGPNESAVDPAKWVSESGGNGWGNQELEYYTSRPQNAFQQDGNLIIKVLEEKFTGADGVSRNYTSARLKTKGKFSQEYGRFEARIKIPYGQGIWPAFWMLGDDIEKHGWPKCGEIDIMENIGKEPGTVHGTIHGPGYSGANGIGAPFALPEGQRFADDFHIYATEWSPKSIRFYVDDHLYETITPASLPKGKKWVYKHPFFILLNVAVGGDWPRNPDASTTFPQTMLVDYVRVYRRNR
jgi:beta-glucanase (GH16 family)